VFSHARIDSDAQARISRRAAWRLVDTVNISRRVIAASHSTRTLLAKNRPNKLGYCRDSARRRLLRPARSLKVTDFNANQKTANNTNLRPISHRFPVIGSTAFDRGSLFSAFILSNYEYRHKSYIANNKNLSKIRLHFCHFFIHATIIWWIKMYSMGLCSTNLT